MPPISTKVKTGRKRDGTTVLMYYQKTNSSGKRKREKAKLRKQKQRAKNAKTKKKKTKKGFLRNSFHFISNFDYKGESRL